MLLLQEAFHFIIHVTYRASYYTYIHMLSVVNSKVDTAVLASILQIMRTETTAQWQAILFFYYLCVSSYTRYLLLLCTCKINH
jgi:hypothetical protein